MKHTMIDCYGSKNHNLENLVYINDSLNKLAYNLGLEPIANPYLIPYYYGRVKEDIGVSGFLLLKGGHITIHTFPLRECYFVDVFSVKDFEPELLVRHLEALLPFNLEMSTVSSSDRRKFESIEIPFNPTLNFGPHYLAEIKMDRVLSMDECFDFLDEFVYKIDMDPITRPYIIKNKIGDSDYLSGIIVIAQSHISIHFDYKRRHAYFDIFSCAAFDYTKVEDLISKLGTVISNELVVRGTKHASNIKLKEEPMKEISSLWQKYIK